MQKNGTRRAAFALALAGVLGFGATQAFADPAPAAVERKCDHTSCALFCHEGGAAYGWCVGDICDCFYH